MRSPHAALGTIVALLLAPIACAKRTTGVPLLPPLTAPQVWNGLEPGAFAVRLDTLMRRAPAHAGWAAADRAVQITIWSPATAVGTQLSYRDYVGLTANQASLAAASPNGTAEAADGLKKFVVSLGNTPAAVEQWFNLPVAASWDAPLATRKYPLIVIAQGNYHSAYNQAVLAEYLASHGYVVATSASPLVLEPAPADSTSVITRARRQAADIEYLVGVVRTRGNVDSTRLGVVAHSFGARAAFVAIADGTPFRSFVSLDGGIANKLGADWLAGSPLDSAQLAIPLLHFYQDKDEIVQPDFTLVRRWKAADRTLVHVADMYHPYFTALGFVAAVDTALHVGPAVTDLGGKVAGVAEMTVRFLDATLKRRAGVGPPLGNAGDSALFAVERIPIGQ